MSRESKAEWYDARRELDKTAAIAVGLLVLFVTGFVLMLSGLVG